MQEVFTNWLKKRHITGQVISDFQLSVGNHPVIGDCLLIPIFSEDGIFVFNKYRRNPMSNDKPKYIYDKGGKVTLYGYHLAKTSPAILITEGEMDALVAWSANIPAVSSTGGAMSFQDEWQTLLVDKEVTICFDNDEAGAKGMVKVLDIIPHAYIVFLPDRPGVKDISDYVTSGGDLHELLRTRVRFTCLQDVIDHRSKRLSLWQTVHFHDAYIEKHTVPTFVRQDNKQALSDIEKAKTYPIDKLLKFNHNTACCLWHKEKTPSMHYYKKTNSVYCFGCDKYGDAIDVYRQLHQVSFKEAIAKLQ